MVAQALAGEPQLFASEPDGAAYQLAGAAVATPAGSSITAIRTMTARGTQLFHSRRGPRCLGRDGGQDGSHTEVGFSKTGSGLRSACALRGDAPSPGRRSQSTSLGA